MQTMGERGNLLMTKTIRRRFLVSISFLAAVLQHPAITWLPGHRSYMSRITSLKNTHTQCFQPRKTMSTLKYTYIIIMKVFVKPLFNKIRMSFFLESVLSQYMQHQPSRVFFQKPECVKKSFTSTWRTEVHTDWPWNKHDGRMFPSLALQKFYTFVFHMLLDKGIKITFHIYGWMYHQDNC